MNELFRIGQNAVMSNLFYMPTDCPTREKLGWCNDAQASCEQMLLNFDTASLFAFLLLCAAVFSARRAGLRPCAGVAEPLFSPAPSTCAAVILVPQLPQNRASSGS